MGKDLRGVLGVCLNTWLYMFPDAPGKWWVGDVRRAYRSALCQCLTNSPPPTNSCTFPDLFLWSLCYLSLPAVCALLPFPASDIHAPSPPSTADHIRTARPRSQRCTAKVRLAPYATACHLELPSPSSSLAALRWTFLGSSSHRMGRACPHTIPTLPDVYRACNCEACITAVTHSQR